MFKTDNNKIVKGNSSRANKIFKNLFKFKKSKNSNSKNLTNIKAIRKSIFLTFSI